jgi:hypothetical protein
MNYRKLQNSRLSNQILEQRYLTNKSLTADVKFTMGDDKKIIKKGSLETLFFYMSVTLVASQLPSSSFHI